MCAGTSHSNPRTKYDSFLFKDADEVFITSTSVGLLPVSKIDEVELPTVRPVTVALKHAYSLRTAGTKAYQ